MVSNADHYNYGPNPSGEILHQFNMQRDRGYFYMLIGGILALPGIMMFLAGLVAFTRKK